MIRIQIASVDGGPSVYSIDSNPMEYVTDGDRYVSNFECMNGDIVYCQQKWDDRIRTLKWNNYILTSPYISTVSNYFRSVEGSIRYINFASIGDSTVEPRWRTSTDWKKMRVIAVKGKYQSGKSKSLAYDSIEIEIQPEQ